MSGSKETGLIDGEVRDTPAHFYRHEISGGLAVPSNVSRGRFHAMEDVVTRDLGYGSDTQCFYLGAVASGLRYFYHVGEHWAVGAQFGTVGDYTPYIKQDADERWQDADLLMRSPFLMAAAKYYWYAASGVSLYSKADVGAQHRHLYFRSYEEGSPDDRYFDEKKWLPAFQLSPIAIELGSHNLRFFAELGYGTEGVFSFGITYHFKRAK